MDLITAAIELLSQLLQSQGAFVFFAFMMLLFEGVAIWALWVSHANKTIALKRKELGMNEVDQAIMTTFKILNSHFLTLAKEKFGDDYFNKKETAIYRYLLTLALDDLKPIYRARIRRNHFNEKGASEWSRYVHDCIEEDINSISMYLDTHYHPQARIPRPELYEWNQSKLENIRHEMEHLFNELLFIAEKNKLKRFFGFKLEMGGTA